MREMGDFFSAHKDSTNTVAVDIAKDALLSCASGGALECVPSRFDNRHMFRVPNHRLYLSAAFIASPCLPAMWRSDYELWGKGVFTSGVANAAASEILRTIFNAGMFSLVACIITNGYFPAMAIANMHMN